MQWWSLCIAIILTSVLYCEFVGDYVQLLKCPEPRITNNTKDNVLHVLLMADPHLLGPFNGHFLDKFYREWHMKRAFQAAVKLFQPESVFVLGDLFDEGEFVNDNEFVKYVNRFHRHFRTPAEVPVISAVGNHDIGFHYKLHPFFTERFDKKFNNTGVRMYTLKDVHFVFINSMAMEMDGCDFCESALTELKAVADNLKCLRHKNSCDSEEVLRQHKSYSRPIVLQHFPTYRKSDEECLESDAPVVEYYRENWEVLSKTSTRLLGDLLRPRLAFAGHTHHYCRSKNMLNIEEYTIASFSWRNKVNPSFLMAAFTRTEHEVVKCDMVHQQTVYNIYIATATICMTIIIIKLYQIFCRD